MKTLARRDGAEASDTTPACLPRAREMCRQPNRAKAHRQSSNLYFRAATVGRQTICDILCAVRSHYIRRDEKDKDERETLNDELQSFHLYFRVPRSDFIVCLSSFPQIL
jgi:hypothetical protein